ncbi:MAG TPA: 2-oxo-tetronate isomerase, partial [Rhizomicrobium sp.]|nr:2-oxo-tetronate isomerase [Rhizomicrobium sp.]
RIVTKLAANLSMMFQDLPFIERFDAAAAAGFSGVEYLFPYEAPAEAIAEKLKANGLTQVIFNSPAGNWAGGERGLAAVPGREQEFRDGVALALKYADATGCKMLHLMAGKAAGDAAEKTFVGNIKFAADAASGHGVNVVIEPINTHVDIPGYFLNHTGQAMSIIEQAGRKNVGLQYDIYHMQIMEGDLARSIKRLLPQIYHMQWADTPGRAEPGTGELTYPWLLDYIDTLGYEGWIGCEYRPVGGTVDGLGWARKYLSK